MHFMVWFSGHPPSFRPAVGFPSPSAREGKKPDGLPFPHFGGKGPGDGGLYPARKRITRSSTPRENEYSW